MIGYRFTEYIPEKSKEQSEFENLLNIFMQLVTITSGDVSEALNWMTDLDRQYNLTDGEGLSDFIDELKARGFISDQTPDGQFKITAKRRGQESVCPRRLRFEE